jgi:phage terminase large subunit
MPIPEGFDFKTPDYALVYAQRSSNIKKLRDDPSLIPSVKEYYRDRPVEFINDWGMTFDPRNAEIGLPTTIPFLLFPRQAEFVDWIVAHWRERKDGLAEKSRDMGVSWLCVAIAVWMWLFQPGTVVGFGSRKEEYVDKIGDPKSLFWKIRQFINLLPKELRPVGYSEKNAPYMRIINPENDSAIVGEAGDNIGRGNRASIYFKDESAFYEHADAIDAALSQTSNCKIDVSTPNGNGNAFYKKRHGGKIPVFSFHWTQDPRKDEVWYKKQIDTLDPVIVAQEIDIDYNASVSDAWIDGEKVALAQRTGAADVQAVGQWIIGIDAAHFGDDEHVIHKRRGRLNLPQVTRRKIDGIQLAALVEEECDTLVAAGGIIFAIVIELDGPGVSCFDQLRVGRYGNKVRGLHTGTRMSDNKNYNLKAKMWRKMKEYFDSPPVSVASDQELRSQIASIKYLYKDGLLLMQDKKTYKKLYGKSPDRADAMALTFGAEEPLKPQQQQQRAPTSFWAN